MRRSAFDITPVNELMRSRTVRCTVVAGAPETSSLLQVSSIVTRRRTGTAKLMVPDRATHCDCSMERFFELSHGISDCSWSEFAGSVTQGVRDTTIGEIYSSS